MVIGKSLESNAPRIVASKCFELINPPMDYKVRRLVWDLISNATSITTRKHEFR